MRAAVALALAILLCTTTTAAPFGKGIFAHIHRANGRDQWLGWNPSELINTPGLSGTQASFTWRELNPAPGVYDWSRVENILEMWDQGQKKVWIEISTANHSSAGNVSMPDYVFDSVPIVTSPNNGSVFPVFWDQGYQDHWRTFLEAFATEYDGDDRIEFLSAGGYSSRHEPRLASRENEATMDQWELHGFDGWGPEQRYWQDGVSGVLDIFDETFDKTRLAVTLNLSEEFTDALLDYVEDHNWIGGSNGFSTRSATPEARQQWEARAAQRGHRWAYFEWGPAGRDNKGQEPLRSLDYIYQRAIGYNGHAPPSGLSYLPWGTILDEVETLDSWTAALVAASAHLTPIGPYQAVVVDFDGDGDVDADDLTDASVGWEARFGTDLDGISFLQWQRKFGTVTAQPSVSATPEPSTAALLATVLVLLLVRRR